MSFNLTNDNVKIFRKDKVSKSGTSYSTYCMKCSSKVNDEWVSGFFDVIFPKGESVNNKAEIAIEECFPIVDKYNDRVTIKWYIKKYTVLSQGEVVSDPSSTDDFVNVPDDMGDLPFALPQR